MQFSEIVALIGALLTLSILTIDVYGFYKGKTKLKEVRDSCEAAVNANNELLPLVTDEKLKLALKVKIGTLRVLIKLINGGIISDNFGWELDEKVKALTVWSEKSEKQSS